MGLRGPAPTPKNILKARGSWRADVGGAEVQFGTDVPVCPKVLGTEARAEWKRMVVQLKDAGLLQTVDRALLACWCEAWGEFSEVNFILGEMRDADPKGWMMLAINAGIMNVKKSCVERMLRLSAQFGFSPAARARISAPQKDEGDADGKGRFFAG